MPKALDLAGRRFGKLLVQQEQGRARDGKVLWLTRCDCGGSTLSTSSNLVSGRASSCGCAGREKASALLSTHGATGTPMYGVYKAAKQRCTNPKTHNYSRYGGRGVEFRFNSFDEFYALMSATYAPGLQLDRIDNNGHYEPGNVKWSTRKEQCNNTGRSVVLTLDGRSMTMTEWARELNIPQPTLSRRLKRYGKDNAERILSREDGRSNNGRKRKTLGRNDTAV